MCTGLGIYLRIGVRTELAGAIGMYRARSEYPIWSGIGRKELEHEYCGQSDTKKGRISSVNRKYEDFGDNVSLDGRIEGHSCSRSEACYGAAR